MNFDAANMIVWLASLAGFLSVVAIGIPFMQKDQRASRLKALNKQREELGRRQMDSLATQSSARRHQKKPGRTELFKKILKLLRLEDMLTSESLKTTINQAGFRGQSVLVSYVIARIAGTALAGIGAFFVVTFWEDFPYPFYVRIGIIALSAVVGFYLPKIIISNFAQKRQQEMNRAFPDTLDLLVICVESGLGIEAAFDKVTEEIAEDSPILAQEFGLTTAELAYLGDRHKAYENFAKRTGLAAAKSLSTTLIQSEKYGTPIGQALKILSQERRDERMSLAEKKGAALPAKLTVPMIVFFLPVLFEVVLGPAIIQIIRMD
ncbi:MAG: type II secretion system F family protein [Rhodospirillaceae bacterium]|jgi:tight adherence protein C|nr:type II secretion system F family protein [Rhodospirillaceae bacterium]MBT5659540.1 type II secretion system F family protein [Rhodospirillaceae bacterium]MBT5751807.1 type II secretion system F family protein [Rhodospirillaceae bacterium]